MTDLTPRQILYAMERALDKIARRFANQKPTEQRQQQTLGEAADQSFESRRAG
jgi:hypothetical protein